MAESLSYSEAVPRKDSTTGGDLYTRNENMPSDEPEEGPPSPTLLDYSFIGYQNEELEEALGNQPSKVFHSVETILATNVSLLAIPHILTNYTNLKNLDLSYNQLTFVPDAIIECRFLVNLVLKNNLIEDSGFPKTLVGLSNLKEINLSGNLLTRVPESVIQLSASLVSLHLGGNRIDSVPREIGLLKKLQVFYLGGNQLTEIPSEIGLLTQLKVFALCENQLETLPSTVSNLKQLKSLLLHRNRITALPVGLIKLRNLMEVRTNAD